MYLKIIYLIYKYRQRYYQILFILKVISICYKIRKTTKILMSEIGDWVIVEKK